MVKNDLIPLRSYYCPFCRHSFKFNRHKCWKDPRNKSCSSCIYCSYYSDNDGLWYCNYYKRSLENVKSNHTSDIKIQKTIFGRTKITDCIHHKPILYLQKALEKHLKDKEEK